MKEVVIEKKRKIRKDKGCPKQLGEEKRCPVCNEIKTLDKFYKRSGSHSHLARSYCIKCERERQKNQDRVKIRFNERERYAKRMALWVEWFRELYGVTPLCQCCGIPLKWRIKNRRGVRDTIVFDHRHGGIEPIKSLYSWITDRDLSDKNKATFLSCDFGILCWHCNICLPTCNRKEWLENAIKYVNER